MNLQYISDSEGQTTGVFIPIDEWNYLKSKYKEIEKEEISIPDWHKNLVRERLDEYNKKPGSALDFDASMDEIKKSL
ncbi:MAG: hypothetical protein M0Q90_16845 [Bacteroidales bacterium]|nr:hypothetical protein [Bacteroidales bacterium]